METTVPSFILQKTRIPGRILGNVLLAMTVFVGGTTAEAFGQKPALKTGKSLENAMLTTVSWASVNTPLQTQLADLMNQSEVAVIRDRRVDPRAQISLTASSVSRWEVLKSIAREVPDGGCCLTENVACVGPASEVYRLPVLIELRQNEINLLRRKMKSEDHRKLVALVDSSWSELAEPKSILESYARAAGVRITNPDLIPHDVWAQCSLPRMAFAEIATVILNQFDLEFKLSNDGRSIALKTIDPLETFDHRYSPGKKLQAAATELWKKQFPEISVKWSGAVATVHATLEQHGQLNAALSELMNSAEASITKPATPNSLRTTTFTFRAERATIGDLIAYFRKNKVVIEVTEEDQPATKAVMKEIVQLSDIKENKAGVELFPLIFGGHFRKVEVLDDRVVLSRE
ncbi:MAG: hypothetical protein U0936_11925 [Planctomycetaceae bacterium]